MIKSKRSILALMALVAALSLADAAPPKPAAYKVGAKDSLFRVYVYKRGFASAFAHDHTIGVTDFEGQVDYRADAPEKSRVVISVDAASLEVLDSELDADDRAEVKSNMDSDEVLDVKKHKKIRFTSTRVKLISKTALAGRKGAWDLRLKVTGTLELHGKKRVVEAALKVIEEGARLVTIGELKVKQTDFGMEPFTAAWGAVGVKDVVDVRFRLASVKP